MTSKFERCVVRLYGETTTPRGPRRRVQGAGFLIDDTHVITCEHVVARCRSPQDGTVELDFPFVPGEKRILRAQVDFARKDDTHDVAGLSLIDPAPDAAGPSRLVVGEYWDNHRWRAPGFPRNSDTGEYAEGSFLGPDARQWIQIQSDSAQGRRVQQGYSGGPVFDTSLLGVAGMVVAADDQGPERVAFMIPMDVLVGTWSSVLRSRLRRPNPYQGLKPFDENACEQFFGREETVRHLVGMVEERSPLILAGASGTGKSSVVRAGLVPELRRRGWRVVVVPHPTADPFAGVAGELLRLSSVPADVPFSQRSAALATAIREGGLAIDARHAVGATATDRVLLVVDQLEELFTLCPQDDVQRDFLRCLTDPAYVDGNGRDGIAVLVCVRDDYLDRMRSRFDFRKGTAWETTLPRIDDDGLRRAVEEPALQAGGSFEPGLVETIMADVRDQPGCLPQLQFVLTKLWDEQEDARLLLRVYQELGGVQGALARKADAIYAEMAEADRGAMKRVFVQLVQLGRDDKGTRRPVTDADLLPDDWNMINLLADERMVVTGVDQAGHRTAQIAHEALVTAWPMLARWVDATSTSLEELDQQADRIIRRHAVGAVVAGPFGSLVVLLPTWTRMGRAIGALYGVEMDTRTARAMVKVTGKAFGGYIGGSILVNGLAVAAKAAPPVFVATSIVQATWASAATAAAGRAWKQYFRLRFLGAAEPDIEQLARAETPDLRAFTLRRSPHGGRDPLQGRRRRRSPVNPSGDEG
ncbi:nSTAND1 domain-containing NTPase [Pseudonocardia saturnea]